MWDKKFKAAHFPRQSFASQLSAACDVVHFNSAFHYFSLELNVHSYDMMIVLAGFYLFIGSRIFETQKNFIGCKIIFPLPPPLHQHRINLRISPSPYSLIPVDLRIIINHINILLMANIMPNMLAKTPTKYWYVD